MRLPSISARALAQFLADDVLRLRDAAITDVPVIPAINTLVSCLSRPQNEHLISFLSMEEGRS
jgi:hypothetical protein